MEIRREQGNKKGGERVRARADDERSVFSFFSFTIRVDRVRLQNAGSIVGVQKRVQVQGSGGSLGFRL